MASLDISELVDVAKEIVKKAKHEGILSSLTVRIIRERVEAHFSLDAGTLEAKEYKRPLKVAIMEAKDETKPGIPNEKVIRTATPERFTPHEHQATAKDTQKPKKAAPKPSTKKRRLDGGKEYKSAAMILSSDVEDEGQTDASVKAPIFSVKEDSTQIDVRRQSSYTVPSVRNDDKPNTSPSKRQKIQHTSENGKDAKDMVKKTSESIVKKDEARNSDSGMSSLFSEFPKRKQKIKTHDKIDKDTRKKPAKDKNEGKSKSSGDLSKDEATIKRLKSYVAACGVRKVWVKVFEGCEKPSQKIKKLKEILAELGMTGRLSLEQAKKIREKRELAKELEDVKSFEQAVVSRGSRSRAASTSKTQLEDTSSEEEKNEEYVKPTKRKSTALRSITAFLDDQSDEE